MQGDLSDWMGKSTLAGIKRGKMHPETYIQNAAPRELNKNSAKLYFDSFLVLLSNVLLADPKLSYIKSRTGQHFFFCHFNFVFAFHLDTKCSSHLISSLNLIKKHSPGKPSCKTMLNGQIVGKGLKGSQLHLWLL